MPDSDNILSILSFLGQGGGQPAPADNVMQTVAPPQSPGPQPMAPPQTSIAPPPTLRDPTVVAQAANADAPAMPDHTKPRSSVLDKIGRIADVLAQVGGATPLYQPTLNAREDRVLKLGDHERQVQSDNIKLATDRFDLGDKSNTRLGQFARGLKAIQAGGGDINAALPELAARMQLTPEQVTGFAHLIAANPAGLDGIIAATTDPKYDKYSGNIVYATDGQGKLHIFQPSQSGDGAREVLPDGYTPVDPLQFVNTGGTTVGVGKQSGSVKKVLPNTPKPDTVLTTTTQKDIATGHDRTQIQIAGMPDRKSISPAGGKNGGGDMSTSLSLLDNIERGFNDLHKLQALPGDGSAANQVIGAIGRTGIGQAIGEQAGSAAAQKRVEIEKDINSLQSEMVKSLPASATRTKFEQEIQRRRMPDPARMSYQTGLNVIADLRRLFAKAQADAAAELAKRTPQTPVKPSGNANGWKIVGVK